MECDILGGGNSNIFGIFTSGEMIHFDEHIFQMGGDHQLVCFKNFCINGCFYRFLIEELEGDLTCP